MIAGLARAENDFDIRANALVCGLKQEPIEKLSKLPLLFDEITDEHLVGFDMAGDELNYPQEKFATLLGEITMRGVHVTLHAGECPHCEQNVLDAVEMGATRIGHGIMTKNLSQNQQTMMVERRIVLEMAPTSNFQTKAVESVAEYPFKDFMIKGYTSRSTPTIGRFQPQHCKRNMKRFLNGTRSLDLLILKKSIIMRLMGPSLDKQKRKTCTNSFPKLIKRFLNN